jgi:hypothetical protein
VFWDDDQEESSAEHSLFSSIIDWRRREQYKRDLLLMLGGMRGPGRGVEIGKTLQHFLLKGFTREEAERQLVLEMPMLAAAEQLKDERRDLILIRYKNSEVLAFREDLEASISQDGIKTMLEQGQIREGGKIVVPKDFVE